MELLYLNAYDIEKINLTNDEIIGAVEESLRAQGNRQATVEPRVHINPNPDYNGHFNVLRGYIEPKNVAGVKVVGDYVYNYKQDLPSELSLLNLFDPTNGAPYAVIDATAITSMRTGAIPLWAPRTWPRSRTRSWATWAPAAPLSGTWCCWTTSMTSRRSASTAAARSPWRLSPQSWRSVSIRRSLSPRTAGSAWRAPTSWWRPPASWNPSPC